MTFASILFGLVIATLIGAVFHLWRGGPLKVLSLLILFSWVGFWVGQMLGDELGWTFGKYGQLNLPASILGSLLFLFAGYWLSLSTQQAKKKQ